MPKPKIYVLEQTWGDQDDRSTQTIYVGHSKKAAMAKFKEEFDQNDEFTLLIWLDGQCFSEEPLFSPVEETDGSTI